MINFNKDGHIHSNFCPHGSDDKLEEYVKNAIKVGISEITFTEHICFPKGFKDPSPKNDSVMREEDIELYLSEISKLKIKYKELIKINAGFEVDYIQGYENKTKEILDKYGEYIDDSILSIHMVKVADDYKLVDYSVSEFSKLCDLLGSVENVYKKYYETVLMAIESDLGKYKPKRIGHLNLVRKFNKVFPYDYSKELILEDIVKAIKLKGYELDYNVSGKRKSNCGECYIDGYLLELAKKYNVNMVLGSDSHSSCYIKRYSI